jgi:hypothetical protein
MRKTALVTGASRGIGFELARLLAADAYDLVLVSRTSEELERARQRLVEGHGISVRCYSKDLSKPGEVLDLWREVEGAGLAVDVLVNSRPGRRWRPTTHRSPTSSPSRKACLGSSMEQGSP